MDTRHTLHLSDTASVNCREEFQGLLKMLQAAVHKHERVFSECYSRLESYKFVEERPKPLACFYLEIMRLKTLVRKLSAEIARVKQPTVHIKIFLPCLPTTCELLVNGFDDSHVQLCKVDRQISLAVVKAIACSSRPGAISLEDQTSKITEILKTLLRQITHIEIIIQLLPSRRNASSK
ncbi:uncharacterized protein C8R40DRAFT_1177765 [Lentinula edodes]|uniref:uncharacterized protein n=1 Tax=Lentinula edodes TaxID=5353 RepID=UPI001E8C9FE1|nr:uncharacterized protein C8R40DRAFT_1177765 [Lentinula edodes]KAH7868499.1 hypothetical protein C8R40DRAFT_1177765 [Lentinula edodes]